MTDFNLFNPLQGFDNVIITTIMREKTSALLKEICLRYNKMNIISKIMLMKEISRIRLDMTTLEEVTETPVKNTPEMIWGKYQTPIIVVAVLVLACLLLFFLRVPVHYALTWPYYAVMWLVGTSKTTSTILSKVPHTVFPFWKMTVPTTTVVMTGPGQLVKMAGYALSAAWTACLAYVGYGVTTDNVV